MGCSRWQKAEILVKGSAKAALGWGEGRARELRGWRQREALTSLGLESLGHAPGPQLAPAAPPRLEPGLAPRGAAALTPPPGTLLAAGPGAAAGAGPGAGAGHRNRARIGNRSRARPSPCCTEQARSCLVLVAPCGLSLPPSGRASPGLLPSHLHLLCPPRSNRWLLSTVGACTAPSPSASPSPACPARCLGAGHFREGARCPTNPAGTGLPRGASSATEQGGQGRKELPGGEEGAARGIPE